VRTLLLCSAITDVTVHNLVQQCANLLTEGIDEFMLVISSEGGNVSSGLKAYDILSALPITLHTHNCGNVDSIASLIFLAGNVRSASPNSRFIFHPVECFFNQSAKFELSQMRHIVKHMESDLSRMVYAFKSRTTFGVGDACWDDILNEHVVWDAENAISMGLIDIIFDLKAEANDIKTIII
jgi:ATP-dependent protease ClpP protease subunit